jgi:hypothetical protein
MTDPIIKSNLTRLDFAHYPAALGAFARHIGCDHEELRKAVQPAGEPPDPRYPALGTLLLQARQNWFAYGDALVRLIGDMHAQGRLFPLTAINEALLRQLLAQRGASFMLTFTGRARVNPGPPSEAHPEGAPSLLTMAFTLGYRHDMLVPHGVPANQAPEMSRIVEVVRAALPATEKEQEAIAYVHARGELYMRRPAENAATEVERILTEAEYAAVRGATAAAVAEKRSAKQLERDLKDATTGTSLTNDMERVARTELAFAHNFGAYKKLKRQAAEIGEDDPLVYKLVSPFSCTECRRIWGPAKDPRHYRLSFIEQRERDGGNFRRPVREWGPVIGPVHPNCTEGPLMFYRRDLVQAIDEAVTAFLAAGKR